MAAFKVLKSFSVPLDTVTTILQPGGVYRAGDIVSGLMAAEARELLELAPADAFEAVDEEAQTIADYVLRVSGNVTVTGQTEVK